MLVVQRVFRAKRTNLHEKYDYPLTRSLQDAIAGAVRRLALSGPAVQ